MESQLEPNLEPNQNRNYFRGNHIRYKRGNHRFEFEDFIFEWIIQSIL